MYAYVHTKHMQKTRTHARTYAHAHTYTYIHVFCHKYARKYLFELSIIQVTSLDVAKNRFN